MTEGYDRRARFLGRVDLLAGLSSDALAEVAAALKPLSVPESYVVCREGETGDQFFLVEAGTLAETVDIDGHAHELARLGSGASFGEGALLGRSRRSATLRAVTDAQLWTLSAADFQELRGRRPEIDTAARHAADHINGGRKMSGAFEVERRDVTALGEGPQGAITIGRSPDNDIVFNSRMVSRHHAVIERSADVFRLRDLNSQNGTYVNGALVRATDLKDGDEVGIGDERFIFDRRAIRRSVGPRGIRIDASNLSVRPEGRKELLHDVTLSILEAEFAAIVGGSGAGKTTLMDALAGVRLATSGHVLYNGRDYYGNLTYFRNVLGYVPQDDIIHTELPLRVILRHAAKLRLPPDISQEDLDQAVDQALTDLELSGQADVKVGRLSGGQRKRASIGVELLTQPKVFFLDEPTSGLDPLTDTQMMQLLRRVADSGSTVVLTTHATKNVMLCDKVVCLTQGGHLAFVGAPERALEYFQVDAFDGIYEKLAREGSPSDWSERFHASDDYRGALADQLQPQAVQAKATYESLGESVRSGGFARQFRQFTVLSRRRFDLFAHNPSSLPSLVMPPFLFTLLALALFHQGVFENNSNSSAALQIVFLVAFSSFIFGLLFGIQEIVKESAIFRRERQVNLGIVPYVLSKTTILAPLLAVLVVVMVVILRLTGRLPDAGLSLYGQLALSLVLTAFVGLALALFTSALVSTSEQATDMLSVWIMPQVLFGGALLAVPAMNAIGRVISAVAPVRWSFEALGHITDLNNQFRVDTSQIGPGLAIQYGDSFNRSPAGNWIILALFIVVPLALTCTVLKRKTSAG